jgi:hypothetical protein
MEMLFVSDWHSWYVIFVGAWRRLADPQQAESFLCRLLHLHLALPLQRYIGTLVDLEFAHFFFAADVPMTKFMSVLSSRHATINTILTTPWKRSQERQ